MHLEIAGLKSEQAFNRLLGDQEVRLVTITNQSGLTAQVCNYGATLVSLLTLDKYDNWQHVVLGFDDLDTYISNPHLYMGATIGPYANRISSAQFEIEGTSYQLDKNDGQNCLHGGSDGIHKVVWSIVELQDHAVTLRFQKMDGRYPGNITIEVRYAISEQNKLHITYNATSDLTTHLNLSHHSYFNLSGDPTSNIEAHQLCINADSFLPIDDKKIPKGNFQQVAASPFDFRVPKKIGKDIDQNHPQLKICDGYDHNFVLATKGLSEKAAELDCIESGISMSIFTTEPGLQFFSGIRESLKVLGNNGRNGICLETQHYPDSPNHPHFPSTLIRPRETYQSETIYQFQHK